MFFCFFNFKPDALSNKLQVSPSARLACNSSTSTKLQICLSLVFKFTIMSTLTTHQVPWRWPSRPRASVPIIRELGNLRVLGLIHNWNPPVLNLVPLARSPDRIRNSHSILPSPQLLSCGPPVRTHLHTPPNIFHTCSEVLLPFSDFWTWLVILFSIHHLLVPPKFQDLCQLPGLHLSWDFQLTIVLTTQIFITITPIPEPSSWCSSYLG